MDLDIKLILFATDDLQQVNLLMSQNLPQR